MNDAVRMSVWSRIYPSGSHTFVFNGRHRAVGYTTAAAAATEGRVMGEHCASAPLLFPEAGDDVRAVIISESQISATISQTNIHGKVYHVSKRDRRPYNYNGEASTLLYITYVINLTLLLKFSKQLD